MTLPRPVLDAVAAGFSVVPADMNKRPKVKWRRWVDEPQTGEEINALGHGSLWAIVTGALSNVVVLDFDGPAGLETMKSLGLEPTVRTAAGAHVYVVHPGYPVKSSAKAFPDYPGLDIKGDKSLAFFYGRSKKGEYQPVQWPPFPIDLDEDLREALFPHPQTMAPRSAPVGEYTGNVPEADRYLARVCEDIINAEQGTSNAELNKAAFAVGGLIASGQLHEDIAIDALLAAAEERGCGTPLVVITSAIETGSERPWKFDPDEDEWIPAVALKLFQSRGVPEPVPFPVDALPANLQDFVLQGAKATSSPIDYIGAGLLPVLGLAIGNTLRLQVNETWFEHAAVWAALVGPPGARKSPAMKLLLRPVKEAQRAYEDAARAEAEANGLDWSEVAPPRLVVDDATIEALFGVLERNPRGVIMRADELTGWVTGMGQYKGGLGRDRQHWLSIWSREDIHVDRVKGANRSVREPFVSVLGGIQPEPLEDLMHGKDDGLLPRILLAQGEYIKPRLARGNFDPTIGDGFVTLWNQIRDDALFDEVVQFSDGGYTAFEAWVNSHYDTLEIVPGELRGAWSKMDGQTARIALILSRALGLEQVTVECVDRAIALTNYFMGQASLVLRASGGGSPWEKKQAGRLRVLARFLTENPGAGRAEIMGGLGTEWALDTKTVDRLLDTLAEVGMWSE